MLDQTHCIPEPTVPLFALTGQYAGPRLVVTGPRAVMHQLADLFWDRDDLATIRGVLVLRPHRLDPADEQPDATLTLGDDTVSAHQAFLQVLGRMTALGMISGRGVPHRWVA